MQPLCDDWSLWAAQMGGTMSALGRKRSRSRQPGARGAPRGILHRPHQKRVLQPAGWQLGAAGSGCAREGDGHRDVRAAAAGSVTAASPHHAYQGLGAWGGSVRGSAQKAPTAIPKFWTWRASKCVSWLSGCGLQLRCAVGGACFGLYTTYVSEEAYGGGSRRPSSPIPQDVRTQAAALCDSLCVSFCHQPSCTLSPAVCADTEGLSRCDSFQRPRVRLSCRAHHLVMSSTSLNGESAPGELLS